MTDQRDFGSDIRTFAFQARSEVEGRTVKSNMATVLQDGAPPPESNRAFKVWLDAINKIGAMSEEVYALFAMPSLLLAQGCYAFDKSTSLAAVIMSRAVVEASAYIYLYKQPRSDGSWSVRANASPDGLFAMLNRLDGAGLTHALFLDADQVRKRGDLVAHQSVRMRVARKGEQGTSPSLAGPSGARWTVTEPVIPRGVAYSDLLAAASVEVELARLTYVSSMR
ncbi:MAG TPA: hypothetical protein VMV28_04920 [Thermoplasmata archaeon]|nr:hypothetical protein [Thermoplasmata archaeon]